MLSSKYYQNTVNSAIECVLPTCSRHQKYHLFGNHVNVQSPMLLRIKCRLEQQLVPQKQEVWTATFDYYKNCHTINRLWALWDLRTVAFVRKMSRRRYTFIIGTIPPLDHYMTQAARTSSDGLSGNPSFFSHSASLLKNPLQINSAKYYSPEANY